MNPNGAKGVIQLGAGIAQSDVLFGTDQNNDLTLTLRNTGDSLVITGALTASGIAVQGVNFAGGTTLDQHRIQVLATTAAKLGTAGADALYGTGTAVIFDGQGAPVGSQDYEQGSSGAYTFVFNAGYGHLEVNEGVGYYTNSVAVLQLGAGITAAQLTATSDSSGNLYLADGTAGDQVKIDGVLNTGYGGYTQYGVAQVQLADGTTLTRQQLLALMTTGTAGADTLYGTAGADTFDGKGAPVGLQDTEQGNGGADTFMFKAGYGQLEVNEDAGFWNTSTTTLRLGAGITAAQVSATSDSAGNVFLTDGIAGDQVKLDSLKTLGYLGQAQYGAAQVAFADGTSWSRSQLVSLASMGTSGADTIIGTSGNDVFDGRGGADTIHGNGGNDTYLFRRGYGALTIDNSAGSGTGAYGEIDFGQGITERDLWFSQSGNDLVVNLLGSADVVDVKGWFGADVSAQLASIKVFDGLKVDKQVGQLVSVMASYQASNPGFNPTTATSMDVSMQPALTTAWHS